MSDAPDQSSDHAEAARPLSSIPPPSLRPATSPPTNPTNPTDALVPIWLTGTVTAGGTGPCYEFLANDGRRLTLYSSEGDALKAGGPIRALVTPASFRQPCGANLLMRLLRVERL